MTIVRRPFRWRSRFPVSLTALLLVAACSAAPPAPSVAPTTALPIAPKSPGNRVLERVDFSALEGWESDDLALALPAMRQSCDKLTLLPPTQPIGRDGLGGLAQDWLGPCGALRALSERDAKAIRAYFADWFEVYRVTDGINPQGLFTGYYEPTLAGARKPDSRFRFPLLGPPADLAQQKQNPEHPYFTRADIEAGALKGKALPLLWVDDAVDLQILQIQGSGRIVLADGTVLHVHYAGDNGWPFVGIGKILVQHGKLPAGSGNMVSVRAWLKAHPDEALGLMAENPRYVFFRLEATGPLGAEGVILTPGRSLAVDRAYIPLGVPLWLQSTDASGTPLRRLVVAQDTGNAITGVVRGDFYWGSGEAAFHEAGLMKSTGSYFIFLPRERSRPVASARPPFSWG